MIRLTDDEIATVEQALQVPLPRLWRDLLQTRGWGRDGEHVEIYHPTLVRELYESFFEHPELLFAPYFPFGCDPFDQELWIIDALTERAATIDHETHPDDWPGEEWLPYEGWLAKYLPES